VAAGYNSVNATIRAACNPSNGSPVINPCGKNNLEISTACFVFQGAANNLCQSGSAGMLGLEAHHTESPPFKNPSVPTISELVQWNVRVVNRLRRLISNLSPIIKLT
jgi:hypothetical protein